MESAALRGNLTKESSLAGTPTGRQKSGSGSNSSRRGSGNSTTSGSTTVLEPAMLTGGGGGTGTNGQPPRRTLDVGGDYPVEDLSTNEGCLLQVLSYLEGYDY